MTLTFLLCCGLLIGLYWSASQRLRPWVLATGSCAFLCTWDPTSFAFLVLLTVGVFACSRFAHRGARWIGRIMLVTVLLVFAGVKSWAVAAEGFGFPSFAVPLGFGFYLLKLIHYGIEMDLGTLPRHGFLRFFNFMLFFPTLLVGPIHRFEDFDRHEKRKRWDPTLFAAGLRNILHGYAKVIILANWLVAHELSGFLASAAPADSAAAVLGECLVYGLYLYYSFAGFSDIAIGIGGLLGQRITANFHYPFLQPNLAAFWRCWHMSLSDWCRRYVFVPALARWRQPAVAMVLAMLAIGLWHEFTFRYLLWGLYHGLGLAAYRVFERRLAPKLPKATNPLLANTLRGVATLATFSFVMLGFAITKNDSVSAMVGDFQLLIAGWTRG